MKVTELLEAKMIRDEKFQWIDGNKNKRNLQVGERDNGTFFVSLSNQSRVPLSLSSVMFHHSGKGTAKQTAMLKDALIPAFRDSDDVLKVLKTVTKIGDWKRVERF